MNQKKFPIQKKLLALWRASSIRILIFIFIISKLNKPKKSRKKGKSSNYSSKKSSSKTRKKSKHGGRYKFTQIHDYL